MTREEAKRELRPIKEMEADIRAVEEEIERLMAIATRMTPSYDPDKVSNSYRNKLEDALIRIEEYRGRLAKLVLKSLDYKNQCLNKVQQIEPRSLRKFLILYYFQDMTLDQMAEKIKHSPRYTYTMFEAALDEYCKIS